MKYAPVVKARPIVSYVTSSSKFISFDMQSRIASLPPASPRALSCFTSRRKPCSSLYLAF